jgi:rhamnose utilization protein RhaD (predicted bifunctional aldolase and dehydrogenase)
MSLDKLITISNAYGAEPEYVIAGGGNTSWKTDEYMYVKGSGTELASIKENGFVKVDLSLLDKIWSRTYSEDSDQREEEVLVDLMASRFPSERDKRPSVETLLHALLPFSFVVHTHPTLVNGITCSRKGAETIQRLFKEKAIWVPITNPGYILAKEVKAEIEKHTAGGNDFPQMIFLQNHGVFVSGNSSEEIDAIYKDMFKVIDAEIRTFPSTDEISVDRESAEKAEVIIKRSIIDPVVVIAFTNKNILEMSESADAFAPLELAMTPDHIVYYGFKPVYSDNVESLNSDISAYIKEHGVNPRLAVVKGVGAFAFNSSTTLTETSKRLFLDDVKVAVYSSNFGGYQFMPKDQIDFIRNWEVEKYRVSLTK